MHEACLKRGHLASEPVVYCTSSMKFDSATMKRAIKQNREESIQVSLSGSRRQFFHTKEVRDYLYSYCSAGKACASIINSTSASRSFIFSRKTLQFHLP